MNIKITSMAAGLALFGFVVTANAGEAISLNGPQMDGVTAGWGNYDPPTYTFKKRIDIQENVYKNVYKDVAAFTYVQGNLADAEAVGTCAAHDCLTETLTDTFTDGYFTQSYSGSLSAAN